MGKTKDNLGLIKEKKSVKKNLKSKYKLKFKFRIVRTLPKNQSQEIR
jgi:hypothetical protein